MSFKLFFLSTFGGLKSTPKVEAEHKSLWNDYQEFLQVEGSDELESFIELEKEIQSEVFRQTKKEIQHLKFKGSNEEKQLNEYEKLKRNKNLKKYYTTLDSASLKRYGNFKESDGLKQYAELKLFVESSEFQSEKEKFKKETFNGSVEKQKLIEFKKIRKNKNSERYEALKLEIESPEFKSRVTYLKDKRKFEKSEAFAKLTQFNGLSKSEDIRFFFKYPKSSEYKNYLAMGASPAKARYEELAEVIKSEAFIIRKAYLEDDKKWEKTEEYQKEQLYNEMKKRPHLVNYFKYKDSKAFDFFNTWEVVFEDRFGGKGLDSGKWSTISKLAENTVGKNFSKAGDLHGFTSKGENISVSESNLVIETKKEKVNSLVWSPVGFQEVEMDYSSGLLTTWNLFEPKFGILEAKVKFDPQNELMDVFYCSGNDQAVRINLLEMGKVNRLGISLNKGGNWHHHGVSLGGLSKGKSYIFRLEWEQGKLTWKINEKEIFSTSTDVPGDGMNLNLATLVVKDTAKLPHFFSVEWVRFFQKK